MNFVAIIKFESALWNIPPHPTTSYQQFKINKIIDPAGLCLFMLRSSCYWAGFIVSFFGYNGARTNETLPTIKYLLLPIYTHGQ
jgi:hypothetical protein